MLLVVPADLAGLSLLNNIRLHVKKLRQHLSGHPGLGGRQEQLLELFAVDVLRVLVATAQLVRRFLLRFRDRIKCKASPAETHTVVRLQAGKPSRCRASGMAQPAPSWH